MAKDIKLKCTANALVDGELVKKGTVAEYDNELAKRLLASNRFENTDAAIGAASTDAPDTVDKLKAALDELDVEYPNRATKAELEELYAEAIA